MGVEAELVPNSRAGPTDTEGATVRLAVLRASLWWAVSSWSVTSQARCVWVKLLSQVFASRCRAISLLVINVMTTCATCGWRAERL